MLARVTSEAPDRRRWTELEILQWPDGYELLVTGGTRVDDEWTYEKSCVRKTAAGVLEALSGPGGPSGLSRLSKQLMDAAAAGDPEMAEVWRAHCA